MKIKEIIMVLMMTTLLTACNNGDNPSSAAPNPIKYLPPSTLHKSAYINNGALKICVINGSTNKSHTINTTGISQNLAPGQIYCANVSSAIPTISFSDDQGSQILYQYSQFKALNWWDEFKEFFTSFLLPAITSVWPVPEAGVGPIIDYYADAIKEQYVGDINEYIKNLIGADGASGIDGIIGGAYTPSQVSGNTLYVLSGADDTSTHNPYLWTSPLVNFGDQSSTWGTYYDYFLTNEQGGVINTARLAYYDWNQFYHKAAYYDVLQTPSMDGIYVCVTDGPNTNSNCSINDNAAPLNVTAPNKDNIGGNITFTNNTQSPVLPSIAYNTDDGSVEFIAAKDFVYPNQEYNFTKADLQAIASTKSKKFGIVLSTNIDKNSPNMVVCSGFYNQYSTDWAEQRFFANYSFASKIDAWTGPYECINYNQNQVQGNQNAQFWQDYGVKAWQNVANAQNLFNVHQDNKVRIQGWVTNWQDTSFNLSDELDPRIDDIMYAFAIIDSNGNLISNNPWSDFALPENGGGHGDIITGLATGRKFYLGVGGWNNMDEMTALVKSGNYQNFINSLNKMIDTINQEASTFNVSNQVAGINIDWEPNGNYWTMPESGNPSAALTKADLQNFLNLLNQTSTALKSKNMTMSISISANPIVLKNVDAVWGGNYWAQIAKDVSTINLMSYDYHAAEWGGEDDQIGLTNFNSPLNYDSNPANAESAGFNQYNVSSAVNYLLQDNISSNQIVAGVPAYGYAYPVVPNNYGSYIPFLPQYAAKVLGLETESSSVVSYNTIYYNKIGNKPESGVWFDISNPNNWAINPTAEQAYTYGSPTNGSKDYSIWISYDNAQTATAKMNYFKQNSLGGVMVWTVNQDLPALPDPQNYANKAYNKDSVVSGLVAGE